MGKNGLLGHGEPACIVMWKIGLWLIAIAWTTSSCANLPVVLVSKDALSAQDHKTLGDSYLAHGERSLAVQQYRAALHQDRHLVPALIALGNLSFEDKDWSKAAAYFRRA